jgi:hypothetical protein
MRQKQERTDSAPRHTGHDTASAAAPGKRTLVEAAQLAPAASTVQRKAAGDGGDVDIHAAAAHGISGSGGPLPHRDVIQQLFGHNHDVSGIRAHTGGAAQQATSQMGAEGYATGNDVAFAGQPDLHLAAHEAAHVVQQRSGVQLAGGVGDAGDAYERNADEVADRVVQGRSAADLLPQTGGAGGAQVQRKEAHGHAGHAGHADHAADAEHDAAGGKHDHEADEGDDHSPLSVSLTPGKPPGAVQKKAAAPKAQASKARKLTIQEATARYAPLVFLAPGETHRPTDASSYIANSSLRWSHDSGRGDHEIAPRGGVDEHRLGHGGYQHQVEGVFGGHHGDQIHSDQDVRPKDGKGDGGNEGFFLDLDNSKHESLGSTSAPMYYEAVEGRFITFWFFYAYNAGPVPGGADNHEGDWERITVKLNANNRATHVAYFQHNGPPDEKKWKEVPKQGSHPIVYSAKGSHASYSTAGEHGLGPGGIVKDRTGKGAQWQTWQHMQNARAQDWYGFGGAWGEVGNYKDTTGPQGPSRWKPPGPEGW